MTKRTPRKARRGPSLEAELAELERTDPSVAKAAANLERVKREILAKPLDESSCCGAALTFDPNVRGMTVGGLWLKGWEQCANCGKYWLDRHHRCEPCDAPTWTIAGSGLSIEIGNGRIRWGRIKVESSETLDVRGLMERIAKLPDLEREVVELRQRLRRMTGIECDHCGDTAIENEKGYFGDGEGTKCISCGMPGHVSVDGDDEDPDLNPVRWSDLQEEGVYCKRPGCEECAERRIEEGNGQRAGLAPGEP